MNCKLYVSPPASETDPSREFVFNFPTHVLRFRGVAADLMIYTGEFSLNVAHLAAVIRERMHQFTAAVTDPPFVNNGPVLITAITLPEWVAAPHL